MMMMTFHWMMMTVMSTTRIDPNEELACALRDLGMTRAVLHAEFHSEGWRSLAMHYILIYPDDFFISEEVRDFAYALGFVKPPDERAWGYVFTEAKKRGYILANGIDVSKKPHCHKTYVTRWKRIVDTGIQMRDFKKGQQVHIHLIRSDFTDGKWALTGPVHGKVGIVKGQRKEFRGKYHIVEVEVQGHNHNCPELLNAKYLTPIDSEDQIPEIEAGLPAEQLTLFGE